MKISELNHNISKLFLKKKYQDVIDLINDNISQNDLTSQFLNILGASKLLKGSKKDQTEALDYFEQGYNKEKTSHHALESLLNLANVSNINKNPFKPLKYYEEAIKSFGYNKKLVIEMMYTYILLNNPKKIVNILEQSIKKNELDKKHIQNLSYFQHFDYKWSQQDFFEFSKKINNTLQKYPEEKMIPMNFNFNKKQKLAFFSSDIRLKHSITKFLKVLLLGNERKNYEIIIISNLKEKNYDETTLEFKLLADKWVEINNLSDIEGINLIRGLNIDIVIDLMGYTSSNKIEYYKNRIAKKQILWLGYCNTTGLNEMDFLISDKNLILKNEQKLYSEKILYMENIWNCYSIEKNKIPTSFECPFEKNGYITFGSFNNFLKINDDVISTWSKILKNVQNSKLFLKSSINKYKSHLEEKFKEHGVQDRIIFKEYTDHDNHLKMYQNIDIALDTFPYNGVTTTFEAILNGLPVLTMKGFNFNSRCGESININLGMESLIADDKEDYIKKAVYLATDFSKLKNIKNKIFSKRTKSVLFNETLFRENFFKLINELV